MPDIWDDDRLLAELGESLRGREAVPPEFIHAAEAAFAWHNIDAELAQLTYDSSLDPDNAMAMRAEAASVRALTFTSAHLTIELEVTQDALLGQITPTQTGTAEIQAHIGAETVPIDEIGCLVIRPIPPSPFRLYCHTADGIDVLTGWITL
jgi:hypothetical protein